MNPSSYWSSVFDPRNLITELLPFSISVDRGSIASVAIWSLALYLAFSPLGDWVIEQLNHWLNFAEKSLYTSQEDYEKARTGWEAQNAFLASLMSIVPFVLAAALLSYLLELGLGKSWAVSLGVITCIGSGVYELGRRDSQADDSSQG